MIKIIGFWVDNISNVCYFLIMITAIIIEKNSLKPAESYNSLRSSHKDSAGCFYMFGMEKLC